MSSQLCIPSLGRPFCLGMLYDCRSEKCIPGRTLWNLDLAIKKSKVPSSDYEIITEDSITTKSRHLDISADLKLSLLGGLVELGGSAKYLNDVQSSERISRVTLQYKSITRFEQLTMEQISDIQHPEVLEDQDATHVVTGIKYGSDAFFVFDRSVSENEALHKVQGELEAAIRAIPISGSAVVNFKTTGNCSSDKIHCKFYGDLILPSNPSTFEEAVKCYKELPKLLNGEDGEKNVPKVVYLTPLAKLDGKATRIVRSISCDLVSQVEDVMKSFHTATMRANDILNHDTCNRFENIRSQISKFIVYLERFKMNFVKKLSILLPKIRGCGIEEKELAELLSSINQSPFNLKEMVKYLQGKSREINQLGQYLKNMEKESNIKFAFPGMNCDLSALVINDEFDHVVCFAFNVTSESSKYVGSLKNYLDSGNPECNEPVDWFCLPEVTKTLKIKSKQFLEFAKSNSALETTAFVVTSCNKEASTSDPAVILYTDGFPTDFEPPGVPGTLQSEEVSSDTVKLSWKSPETGGDSIVSYKVYLHPTEEHEVVSKDTNVQINFLVPGTEYQFQVQSVSTAGVSARSPATTFTTGKKKAGIAENLKKQSRLIKPGKPEVYQLPVNLVHANKKERLYRYNIGDPLPTLSSKPEKVLMVVGATGAGKSTLINGFVNFIFEVEWKDTFRFKIISDEGSRSQAHSQTKSITAYSFHCPHLPYILTIIDTPGFGDTDGIERDKRIAGQIKQFFSGKDRGGVDQIHGIGFVAQASLARLTPTQKYIFDAVLSIFGKNIVNNIFLLTTFADASTPSVLEATKLADIPYKEYFKFNNSALFASNVSTEISFDSMFWEMGKSSFEHFLVQLTMATAQSLALTREVLQEREHLEALIPGLQDQVRVGLAKLEVIKQEEKIIEQHEAEINANKNFTYYVDDPKFRKNAITDRRHYTTTCMKCTFTCHRSCMYSDDNDKVNCSVMRGGYCTACPNRCSWDTHRNLPYIIEYYTERKLQTSDDLKKRYDTAKSDKEKVTAMMVQKEKALNQLQLKVYSLINQVRKSIKRLDEIALRPNPLSEIEYINLLIESEKQEQQPNWQQRVQQYMKIREEAKFLKKMPEVSTEEPKNKSWWSRWLGNN